MTARLHSTGNQPRFWWPVLFPLLLAALFAVVQLDANAFNRDEPDSMYSAGIYSSGPGTLPEVWRFIEENDPNNTQGWTQLLFIWGRIAGWSEPAIRTLPFLAGMLALALLYRTGRDLFSPQAGLLAVLLASASVFFLAYMAIARAYVLVVLFTTMIIWSYWRLALDRRPSGTGAALTLFAGCTGLLYSHYSAALFLPAPGLFHLLFVTRNRRWWRTVLILVMAMMVALLQVPGFLKGLSLVRANEGMNTWAMSATELPGRLLYVLSNFLVSLTPLAGALFIFLLLLALAYSSARRLQGDQRADASWMLVFVTATTFLTMLAANEIVRIIVRSRIRYMLALLPPVALLAGKTLHRHVGACPRAVPVLLALWLILGPALVLTETNLSLFRYPSTFHHVQRILQQRATTGDLVVLERALRDREVLYLHPDYISSSDQPWDTVFWTHTNPLDGVGPLHSPYTNLWLVYPSDKSDVSFEPDKAPGRVFCERMENIAGFTVERHARASTGCDDSPVRLEFDRDIQLTGPELSLADGLLHLEAGLLSADDYLLAHYSLALHVIDPLTGERVAQGDTGVGPGAFVRLASDIDLSALPAGDYELHVALYDWQTGERLVARNPVTGAVSDMHVLQGFRID